MNKFESVDDILEFAIAGEVAASQFYMELAGKMKNPAMTKVFEDFAKEELGHKSRLENIKQGKTLESTKKVADLKMSDYVVDIEPKPDMDYGDALVLAMKKEEAAHRLYLDLAAVAEAEELTDIFLYIAEEEAKHKLRFETEYDENVLKEN